MKKLLITIIVAICLSILLAVLTIPYQHGDGLAQWTFRIHVYDSLSLKPIPNAEAVIIVQNENSMGSIESFVAPTDQKQRTDSTGLCLITSSFNFFVNRSLLISKSYMNFRHRNLYITANGYKEYSTPLKTLLKTSIIKMSNEKDTTDISVKLLHL